MRGRIHGLSMSLDYWEGIWQHFSAFRNVRIDVPGHGGSEPRLEGLELEQFGASIGISWDSMGSRGVVPWGFEIISWDV